MENVNSNAEWSAANERINDAQMWLDEAQGRFDDMQGELDQLSIDMVDLEGAKDGLATQAADAGYDPDYEYMDWSEWEEGDATGTDWEPPACEGDDCPAECEGDDCPAECEGDDCPADDGSGDGAAAAAGGDDGSGDDSGAV